MPCSLLKIMFLRTTFNWLHGAISRYKTLRNSRCDNLTSYKLNWLHWWLLRQDIPLKMLILSINTTLPSELFVLGANFRPALPPLSFLQLPYCCMTLESARLTLLHCSVFVYFQAKPIETIYAINGWTASSSWRVQLLRSSFSPFPDVNKFHVIEGPAFSLCGVSSYTINLHSCPVCSISAQRPDLRRSWF
jgi:hypothetical protein